MFFPAFLKQLSTLIKQIKFMSTYAIFLPDKPGQSNMPSPHKLYPRNLTRVIHLFVWSRGLYAT
jgi:hypothetical protein